MSQQNGSDRTKMESMTPYITQTMRKCQRMGVHGDARAEALYGEMMNQTNSQHTSHPYYTHSQFANLNTNTKIDKQHKRDSDHIYELPKQQQGSQQFDQNVKQITKN